MYVAVLLCIAALLAPTQASECETTYHGTCHNLVLGSCQSGQKVSYSHCGFLSKCCYDEHKPQTATSSPLTSHGQCGNPLVTSDNRIVGGKYVSSGELPWQVSLRYKGQHMCGGTLIDNQWVLTASHCFEDTYTNYWTVAVGSVDLDRIYSSQVYKPAHVITHAGFNGKTMQDDIAMVKLEKPVDITGSRVRPACLPADINEDYNKRVCTVSGWGARYADGPGSRYLQDVSLPVMTNSLCKYYLGRVIFDHNICAGINEGGRDACQGDSGGPMVCKVNGRWEIAGVVSWGYGCGDRNTPGIYTRVTSFIDWINRVKKDYQ